MTKCATDCFSYRVRGFCFNSNGRGVEAYGCSNANEIAKGVILGFRTFRPSRLQQPMETTAP